MGRSPLIRVVVFVLEPRNNLGKASTKLHRDEVPKGRLRHKAKAVKLWAVSRTKEGHSNGRAQLQRVRLSGQVRQQSQIHLGAIMEVAHELLPRLEGLHEVGPGGRKKGAHPKIQLPRQQICVTELQVFTFR